MVLQKKYLSQPAAIASYNLNDLTSGRGILTFYAGETLSGAGIVLDMSGACIMSINPFYSQEIIKYKYQSAGAIGTTDFPEIRHKYDVLFQVPAQIQGQAIINITCGISTPTTTTVQLRPTIAFYRLDGSVESFLASGAGLFSGAGLGITAADSDAFSKTVPVLVNLPNTHFGAGDTLRMYVEIWGGFTGTANAIGFGYAQDPADRDQSTTGNYTWIIKSTSTTQLKVYIPFIPDL